jgi:Tol biopolymer transport system component
MSSADPLIKDRLSGAVDPIRFDVEGQLRMLPRRSAMRQRGRRVATVALAAVIALGAVAAAWHLLPLRPGRGPAGGGEPPGKIAYTHLTVRGEATKEVLDYDVYVANGDGSDVTPLVIGPDAAYAPAWSPDGSKMAFIGGDPDASSPGLWVANADGSDARPILQDSPPLVDDQAPAWSPDGTRIAFVASEESGNAVWVANADGTGANRVVRGNWRQVAWSPDGTKLALTGSGDRPDYGLYVVGPDGSALRRLVEFDELVAFPTWSPDGRRIAFTVQDPDDEWDYMWDVDVVDADGTDLKQLTAWDGLDAFPVWSPDGRWIVFCSDRDATAEELRSNRAGESWFGASLYLMRPDGSGVRRIVDAHGKTICATSWVR